MTLLLLVRHGHTPTAGRILTGWAKGVHLSERGREQAEALVRRLEKIPIDAIYSSPLERCRETAAPLAKARGLPVRLRRDLLEVDYGDWSGRSIRQLARTRAWRAVQDAPSAVRFPGGETLRGVQARAVDAVRSIAEAHPEGCVAVITHADVVRLALAGLGALDKLQLVPRPSRDALIAGTLATRWPGRLEEIRWQGRRFLLDGAHNLEAMTALTQALAAAGLAGKLDLVFSCLSDKPLAAMAELLRPLVGEVQVTPLPSPRARDLEELARAFPGCRVAASVAEALEAAAPHRLTLVTGSLRLVGEALSFLRGQA